MKVLLFNEDQLALFNYMRKPVVKVIKDNSSFQRYSDNLNYNILSIEKSEIEKAWEAK